MTKSTILYILSFIIMGVMVLMMFSSLEYTSPWGWRGFNVLTSSDATLLHQISKDFIKHPASILDWDFGTCFNMYPTFFIMLLNTFTFTNPSIVVFSTALIHFSLLILLINILLKKINDKISIYSLIISNLSILIFLEYAIKTNDFGLFTSYLFLPYHLGAFINAICSLILAFSYFKKQELKYLIPFIIINILAVFSDFIYIIYFILPFILAVSTFLFFLKSIHKKGYIIITISLILSAIFGYILQKAIIFFNVLHILPYQSLSENMFLSLKLMSTDLFNIIINGGISTLIALLALFSIIVTVYFIITILFKNKSLDSGKTHLLLYLLFVVYFFILTIAAPVLNGFYRGIDCIRYIIPAIYLVIFNLGLLTDLLLIKYAHKIKYIAIILIVIHITFISIFYSKNNPTQSIEKIRNYYPSIVHSIDSLSKKYSIKNGVANFWDSRFTTVFSKQHVCVNTIVPPFNPHCFANNSYSYLYADYTSNKPLIYNFIVLDNFTDTAGIYKVFNKNSLKKVTIDTFEFYLVPDFILNKELNTFELVHKE